MAAPVSFIRWFAATSLAAGLFQLFLDTFDSGFNRIEAALHAALVQFERLAEVLCNGFAELIAVREFGRAAHVAKFHAAAIPFDSFTGIRFDAASLDIAFPKTMHGKRHIFLGGLCETLESAFQVLDSSRATLKA